MVRASSGVSACCLIRALPHRFRYHFQRRNGKLFTRQSTQAHRQCDAYRPRLCRLWRAVGSPHPTHTHINAASDGTASSGQVASAKFFRQFVCHRTKIIGQKSSAMRAATQRWRCGKQTQWIFGCNEIESNFTAACFTHCCFMFFIYIYIRTSRHRTYTLSIWHRVVFSRHWSVSRFFCVSIYSNIRVPSTRWLRSVIMDIFHRFSIRSFNSNACGSTNNWQERQTKI